MANAQSNGPSGKIHEPCATPNSPVRLATTAVRNPARGPYSVRPSDARNHVVAAKHRMNGTRSTHGSRLPVSHSVRAVIQKTSGG